MQLRVNYGSKMGNFVRRADLWGGLCWSLVACPQRWFQTAQWLTASSPLEMVKVFSFHSMHCNGPIIFSMIRSKCNFLKRAFSQIKSFIKFVFFSQLPSHHLVNGHKVSSIYHLPPNHPALVLSLCLFCLISLSVCFLCFLCLSVLSVCVLWFCLSVCSWLCSFFFTTRTMCAVSTVHGIEKLFKSRRDLFTASKKVAVERIWWQNGFTRLA